MILRDHESVLNIAAYRCHRGVRGMVTANAGIGPCSSQIGADHHRLGLNETAEGLAGNEARQATDDFTLALALGGATLDVCLDDRVPDGDHLDHMMTSPNPFHERKLTQRHVEPSVDTHKGVAERRNR